MSQDIGPLVLNGLLWLLLRSVVAVVGFFVIVGIGGLFSSWLRKKWPTFVSVVVAFVAAGLWELFALYLVVMDVVNIVLIIKGN
jgi:hypothetical protein